MEVSSRREACYFIDEFRKVHGGMLTEQRERMQRTEPEILEMFDNMRQRLGALAKTSVSFGKIKSINLTERI